MAALGRLIYRVDNQAVLLTSLPGEHNLVGKSPHPPRSHPGHACPHCCRANVDVHAVKSLLASVSFIGISSYSEQPPVSARAPTWPL